MKEQAKIILQ